MTADLHNNLAVLVVEDEPRLRDLLVRAIGSWGFTVAGARSAEEALKVLTATPHHIVVLDLNLPGEMDGLDCLEAIRHRWPDMQAIILTGFGSLESAKKAIHLDVVDFLTKPCHLGDLEKALARAQQRILERREPPVMEIPPEPALATSDPSEPTTLEELERRHILMTLERNKGNRAATAAELGISLRTLYYRLGEYQKQGYLKNE